MMINMGIIEKFKRWYYGWCEKHQDYIIFGHVCLFCIEDILDKMKKEREE